MKLLVSLLFAVIFVSVFAFTNPSSTYANTSITASDNGSGSNNSVNYSQTSNTDISQSNTGIISNIIRIFTNTGNNSSSNNTGANTTTHTGNASANVNIENNQNSNYANVPEFGMIPGVLAALTSGGTFLYFRKKIIK